MLNDVVNGEGGTEKGAGDVEVEFDWFVGIVGFGGEVDEGGDDVVGGFVVDEFADPEFAIAEEGGVEADEGGVFRSGVLILRRKYCHGGK